MEMTKLLFVFRSTSEVLMRNPSVTEINNCHAFNGEDDDPLDHQVESDMTEDEVKKFEEDWKNLWNPEGTQKEIEKLTRTNI